MLQGGLPYATTKKNWKGKKANRKKARAMTRSNRKRRETLKSKNYAAFINELIVDMDLKSVKNNRDS